MQALVLENKKRKGRKEGKRKERRKSPHTKKVHWNFAQMSVE